MTSINNMPNEILAEILRLLETPDLLSARQVSLGWEALIDEVVGMSVNVGVGNEYTSPAVWNDLELVEEIGVRECLIGTISEVDGPPFKYPQVVRTLSFEGPVTSFSFLTLLTPLPALQHLSLHYSALEGIEVTSDMITTRLLKSLKITSHCITLSRNRQGAVRFTKNVITFLTNVRSCQLEKCILDLPFLPEFEIEMTTAIFHLVGIHHNSLQVLQIYFGLVFELIPEEAAGVRVLFSPYQWDSVNLGLRFGTMLKRICFAGPNLLTQNGLWTKLFEKQRGLGELFYMNDIPGNSHGLNVILGNSSTLSKILLHVNAVDERGTIEELDCSVFVKCHSLTHLLIRGRPALVRLDQNDPLEMITHRLSFPRLVNCKALPNKISLLSVRDIHLRTVEIAAILRPDVFPNLKRLRLVEVGTFGDMGILSEQLLEIFNQPRLLEMEFVKCFNRFVFKSTSGLQFKDELMINYILQNWSLHLRWDEDEGAYVRSQQNMFQYRTIDQHLRANDVCDVVFK